MYTLNVKIDMHYIYSLTINIFYILKVFIYIFYHENITIGENLLKKV